MRSFVIAALLGFVAAQSSASNATECHSNGGCSVPVLSITRLSSSSVTPTPSTTTSATPTGSKSVITVATDGSAQFTAINAALAAAQNSGIPTVSVLAGTYSEAVTVLGTATVTILGPSPTNADYSENKVTIAAPTTPFSINTSNVKGVTVRNINIVNSAIISAGANAVAVSLRGSNVAFYGCSIISPGATAISATYGLAFFANSYIEGSDKIFYNLPTAYVYNSTIVPLSSSASIVYSKGGTPTGGPFANSTVVFDSSSIQQKPGYTNTGIFLAAPNNVGAVVIFRNTAMGSLISPAGIHSSAATISSYFGEFQTTGAGSYGKNAAARASYDVLLSPEQVSQFTISKIYGNAFFPYGSSSLSWVDQDVISSLQASDSAQLAAAASSASSTATPVMPASSIGFSNSTIAGSLTVSATLASSTCTVSAATPTIVVSKNPRSCEYSNVTAAVNALPNDSKAYVIQIGAGTYVEQLSITRNGKVTLIGATNFTNDYTQNQVRIEFSKGALTNLGQNEQTPVINAKKTNDNSGLAMYNIDFVNTYPQTSNTAALAADFYGANIAAYGCSFIGYQDTLLANKGTQVFSNCYIEGSVDFIWGFSTAYFHKCMIVSNTPGACIAAQSRATANTVGGYVFDSCMVTSGPTYGGSSGTTYLGRPYSQYSIAIYMNSYLDKHISTDGWQVWQTNNPQTSGVMFGEFNNSGPGSWQATTQRVSFATNLTAITAAKYALAAWIGDTTWLDMNAYNSIPSYSLTGPSSTSSSNATTTGSGSTTTATVNAHPDSGTVPPAGAIIVSVDGSNNASFTNITAALASLPQDKTNQTIFVYSGTYNEQVPSIKRPGAVRIIGYTTGSPGQSYKSNQVTISYSRGLSVSPLPVGHSNAETAVVATASNRISFYNINMVNTDNLDGSEASYVTLAASIYGNDIAFYGCSFDGWQDTLLNGATAGYQYYESCYIGGAIDFIWGYSKAYFKGCTIGAKRKSSAITAHSRSSMSAIGGYIFDQCLFTTAPGATDDLNNKVYLGRPYSQYALVVVKNSYLDSVIIPAAWKIWSATDPRTGAITFAEYNNSGPSNWENNVAARESFGYATLLTSDTYSLSSVMDSTEWIDMTYWNSIVTPQPSVVVPIPANITVGGNSTFDGTTPPAGALIVSKTPIAGITTYDTIQAALNVAPASSKTNATIFIYPGIYEEQLIINKSGHTIFRGYSSATDDYSQNQVTIQFSHGVSTQAATGSNTDGATVYARGNYFHGFNINFRNNNGTQQDIASLGFAVQSSKFASLYGCQIYGNQDTLAVSGSLFTFKTYIEGNVDFIYGSGSAYFLDSTISPNEDGISITAHKRTTNTTNAAFVFDTCTLKPAAGTGPFTNVGLGRPWNSFARVAFVDCNFDSMIKPAGWNYWSKSNPQTDGVTFGEYHNSGAGSGICNRASFSDQLSDAEVVQFQLGSLFPSTSFIDFQYVDTQPFAVGVGSAQTCSTAASSSVLPTSTGSSSASLFTIGLTPSSSLPLVTAYTTTTVTAKLTASTLISGPEITLTTVLKATETISLTRADVIKTSTLKATATVSFTSPDLTSTSTFVVTQDDGLTITPEPITKAAATSTVKGTTTFTVLLTSSPKPTSITVSQGSTIVITSSVTPKAASTTAKTTVSIAPTSTRTTTVVPKGSVTVSSISVKTVTKKSTTTLSCIPTAGAKRKTRRGAVIPRALASTTTITLSTTVSSLVATTTATQAGSTAYVTQTDIATKTTSLKASTSTLTVTSIVKTSTFAQAGSTYYATVTSTNKIGKTTTLKASTVSAPTVTISSLKAVSKTSTILGEQQTVTVTQSSDVTSRIKTTLPASTSTKYQTVTLGAGVAVETVTGEAKTKTVVVKATSTVVQWATKTAEGAAECTA